MWSLFKNSENAGDEHAPIDWKHDFSGCSTAEYLQAYSVCLSENHQNCRFVAKYAGIRLCSNPEHKTFIPEDAEPFNPAKR